MLQLTCHERALKHQRPRVPGCNQHWGSWEARLVTCLVLLATSGNALVTSLLLLDVTSSDGLQPNSYGLPLILSLLLVYWHKNAKSILERLGTLFHGFNCFFISWYNCPPKFLESQKH